MHFDPEGTGTGRTDFKLIRKAQLARQLGVSTHTLDRWVAAKLAYDANRTKDDALDVGLREARRAFVTKGEG